MSSSPQTSTPVNGWVAVPAANLDKADGYVVFEGEDAQPWHFIIVNVSGASDQSVACSKLSEAIAEFALMQVEHDSIAEIFYHEPIAERLALPSSYVILA